MQPMDEGVLVPATEKREKRKLLGRKKDDMKNKYGLDSCKERRRRRPTHGGNTK